MFDSATTIFLARHLQGVFRGFVRPSRIIRHVCTVNDLRQQDDWASQVGVLHGVPELNMYPCPISGLGGLGIRHGSIQASVLTRSPRPGEVWIILIDRC